MTAKPLALVLVLLAALPEAPHAQRQRAVPGTLPADRAFDAAAVVVGAFAPGYERLIDVDGDGTMEVMGLRVEGWSTASTINLARIAADGTPDVFWSDSFYTLGSLPKCLSAVGDLNGDGLDDLVVLADEGLWTWTTNGFGPPTAHGSVPVPVLPYPSEDVLDLALGDFDGDGRLDPVVLSDDQVNLWRSDVDGQPLGPVTVPVSTGNAVLTGNRLLVADLLPDGFDEIVVSNGRNLALYTHDAGTLELHVSLPASNAFVVDGMGWGDVDGDGDGDLVAWADNGTYGTTSGQHRVLEQVSPGSYLWRTADFVNGGPATDFCDVDGDGDLDGVCCGGGTGGGNPRGNTGGTDFQVSLNDGQGNFAENFRIPGLGARRLAGVMDVDGDGHLDLVAGRAVYFARRPIDRDPIFTMQGIVWTGPGGDHDGDGDRDENIDLDYAMLEGRGDGARVRTQPTVLGKPPFLTSYEHTGDWDGDGDLDQIGTAYDGGVVGVHLVRNLGGGTYEWGPPAVPNGTSLPSYQWNHAFDVDGDGDLDLVTSKNGGSAGLAYLYWNDGDGYFSSGGPWLTLDVGGFADLDGDGREDVLVSEDRKQVGWLRNQGGGVFGAPYWFPLVTARNSDASTITVVDMDGDGDLDVWGMEDRDKVVWLENDGQGQFTAWANRLPAPAANLHLSSTYFQVRALDVDDDGLLDALRFPGRGSNSAILYRALAPGGPFVELDELVLDARTPCDMDGDGDLDLVGRAVHENLSRRHPAAVFYRQLGAGTPGGLNLVPKLGALGPFKRGVGPPLTITNGRGGSPGLLACSPRSGVFPNTPHPGVTSYLDLSVGILGCGSFVLGGTPNKSGAGAITLGAVSEVGTLGRRFYLQAFLVDPDSASGFSATNAVVLDYGQTLMR